MEEAEAHVVRSLAEKDQDRPPHHVVGGPPR
jgi:hypothetical protein